MKADRGRGGTPNAVSAGAVIADNRLVRGDGGVRGVQGSGITVDDSNNISGVGTLGCGAITSTGALALGANTVTCGEITASSDTDSTHVLGRGAVHSAASDYAYFSHYDHRASSANFGIRCSAAGQTAISTVGTGALKVSNVAAWEWSGTQFYSTNAAGPSMQDEATSVTNPVFCPDRADTGKGLGGGDGDNNLSLISNSAEALRVDNDSTASYTRLLIYDVDNGQLERVQCAGDDSGGAGYKLLRIPN